MPSELEEFAKEGTTRRKKIKLFGDAFPQQRKSHNKQKAKAVKLAGKKWSTERYI